MYRTKVVKGFVFSLVAPLTLDVDLARADSDLANMDIEQLMDMSVTTVSKREQTFGSAAAAIYTIREEDIRRSGATSLPEVLKLAPGMEVARINNSLWAVSARGFNSHFSNKLLILIDGRSVYSQAFSGVHWDEQFPAIDDIQRIEIIRGPGASLWGANAVNGVINIVTYDSEQTQGTQFVVGSGNEELLFARTRQGFKLNEITGRVNVQYREVDPARFRRTGEPAQDRYTAYSISTRLDWNPSIADKKTMQLGYTETQRSMQVILPDVVESFSDPKEDFGAKAGYVTTTWLHELENGDGLFLQGYVDSDNRIEPLNEEKRIVVDTELQYNHRQKDRHRVTWGLGFRRIDIDGKSTFVFYSNEPRNIYSVMTMFSQDEYRVTENIKATLGVKFETGSESNLESQPSLRLAWQSTDEITLWGAVSRASRTPSHIEGSSDMEYRSSLSKRYSDILHSLFPQAIGYSIAMGNDKLESEILVAYETGLRWQVRDGFFVDIAAFVNEYDRLVGFVPTPEIRMFQPEPPYVGFIAQINNVSKGQSEGVEVSSDYIQSDNWRIKTAYTYFNFNTRSGDALLSLAQFYEVQSPLHQFLISSLHTLPNEWEFDWSLRYVAEIFRGKVPAYTDFSLRLAKSITKNVETSLVAKNLFDETHVEFLDTFYGPPLTEIERSVFLQMSWRH